MENSRCSLLDDKRFKEGLTNVTFIRQENTRATKSNSLLATHAASNGIDPKTLASLLGHTKASFTLDRYAHVTTDMQRQASGIVGNFITDMFGEELKPWQSEENQAKEQ